EKKIVLLCSPSFGGRKRWGGVSNHSSDFRLKKVQASFSNCDHPSPRLRMASQCNLVYKPKLLVMIYFSLYYKIKTLELASLYR
ncbi:hypothetical protein COX67_00110, partial [Candidatus Falkowbacteria bacterium CG_4_10_14_0_2_um_filter_36_22]